MHTCVGHINFTGAHVSPYVVVQCVHIFLPNVLAVTASSIGCAAECPGLLSTGTHTRATPNSMLSGSVPMGSLDSTIPMSATAQMPSKPITLHRSRLNRIFHTSLTSEKLLALQMCFVYPVCFTLNAGYCDTTTHPRVCVSLHVASFERSRTDIGSDWFHFVFVYFCPPLT